MPSARAGRLLLARLLDEAERGSEPSLLIPPHVVGPGGLLDACAVPPCPVASDIERLLAWRRALAAEENAASSVFPKRPWDGSLTGAVAAAQRLDAARGALRMDGLSFSDVARLLARQKGHPDADRWAAMSRLEAAYVECLEAAGLADLADVWLGSSRPRGGIHGVLLAGVPEVPLAMRGFLKGAAWPVICLVQAPASESGMLDEFGCPIKEQWLGRVLPINDADMRVAEGPRDQSFEALEFVRSLASDYGADEFALGSGDAHLLVLARQMLEAAGARVHSASAMLLHATRPVQLLHALFQAARSMEAEEVATLLRHPDAGMALGSTADTTEFIVALDRLRSERLTVALSEAHSLSGRLEPPVRRLVGALARFSQEYGQERRGLSEWAATFAEVLDRAYGRLTDANAEGRADPILAESVALTVEVLRQIHAAHGSLHARETFSAAEAARLMMQLTKSVPVPEPYREASIELLDWLEMAPDDAPVKVLLGMNEGSIPEPLPEDPLLPETLRTEIGLPDSDDRYARDAFLLMSILHSTPHVTLISGRVNADGEPVPPSRLLLACEDAKLAERARQFFGRSQTTEQRVVVLYQPGTETRFAPVRPPRQQVELLQLPVTAFRDYLACPYRFYLKHVARLQTITDRINELDAASFGAILHEAIKRFSRSEEALSGETRDMEDRMRQVLSDLAEERFGHEIPVPVAVQLEHAERRLRRFIRWHEWSRKEGWRYEPEGIEADLEYQVEVDGTPCKVVGRADRIEQNQRTGAFRILDFKSPSRRPNPDAAHRDRRNPGKWTDLQLPLYRWMFRVPSDADVSLGYVWLAPSDKPAETMWLEAPWTQADYDSALECAREVIRSIRNGVFWPPNPEPLEHDDGLGALCMDRCAARPSLLANPPPPWSPQ